MLKGLNNYIVSLKIKQHAVKVKKHFVEWNAIQSAVILLNGNRSNNYEAALKLEKEIGKPLDVIVYYDDKISESESCFLSLNKKELSLLGMPKPMCLEKIKNKKYDILIDANFDESPVLKLLSGIIGASCKVGPSRLNYNSLFDISIGASDSLKIESYLNEVMNYLKMIKTK